MDEDGLTVDDIVTGPSAAQLGEGVIPTKAILIVETISEHGAGLRFLRSTGLDTWQAIGMVRSALLRIEDEDVAAWTDIEDD